MGVERERVQSFGSLAEGLRQAGSWYLWGPYLGERQWGTVREDYSADGEAWNHLPHDHARSRAYRWGEDGLAGFSDVEQRLCLALALWNGRDPILKERIFGLTGGEGNHGEDAKEYWWYLDALPSHAWNRWRYHYPAACVPLRAPADGERPPRQAGPGVRTAGHRGVRRPLLGGRGALREGRTGRPADDRGGHQRGSGGRRAARAADRVVPQHVVVGGGRRAGRHGGDRPDDRRHPAPFLGELELVAGPAPDGTHPELLFCDNETNVGRLYGLPGPRYPKDGVNDHVVAGAPTVNPDRRGSKCAAWYRLRVAPGDTVELRLRLRPAGGAVDLGSDFAQVRARRRAEADEFYAELTPAAASEDEARVMLEVFAIDGGRDIDFLSRAFDKLLLNFTWWVNLEDADGSNLFEGGFLGLDNIGPLDRSHLPAGSVLEQSDATGWMAGYALAMGVIATVLRHARQRPADDLVQKFLEHFAAIRDAIEAQGLWDETDGLFYDQLAIADGGVVPVAVRSMVGIIPMLAAGVVDEELLDRTQAAGKHLADFLDRSGLRDREQLLELGLLRGEPGHRQLLLGVVGIDRLERLFEKLFDPAEFLSDYGLRSLSAYHREHPYVLDAPGVHAEIDYEPAESTIAIFGGNSNWRGPVWFPLNYLVIAALERYHRFFGDDYTVEYPTGSGRTLPLEAIARDLWDRLIAIFLVGAEGRRPCFGWVDRLQRDPLWKDNVAFFEYFHADNGAGLGASHQTGWTGLVADIIRRRHGEVTSLGDLLRALRDGKDLR